MTTQTLRTCGYLLQARNVPRVEARQLVPGFLPDDRLATNRVERHRITEFLECFERLGVIGVRESVGITERHRCLVREFSDGLRTIAQFAALFLAVQPRENGMRFGVEAKRHSPARDLADLT